MATEMEELTQAAIFSSIFGLFSANITTYKQAKLLVHVCLV